MVVVENVFGCHLYKTNVLIGNEGKRKEERGKRKVKEKNYFQTTLNKMMEERFYSFLMRIFLPLFSLVSSF